MIARVKTLTGLEFELAGGEVKHKTEDQRRSPGFLRRGYGYLTTIFRTIE